MKLHSDTLTHSDLFERLPAPDLYVQVVMRGSRKRARGFDFRLEALRDGGRWRNSGRYGAEQVRAASWDEHGYYFAALFELDPAAIIGYYDGREDFHRQTDGKYRERTAA